VAANTAIQELQHETLRELGPRQVEPILIATEVAADFRAMQRIISEQPQYHLPLGYVHMLVSGQLTAVHVRVNNPNGMLGDFRTPSEIPSNHVGGSRVASEAAQQMRILLNGRNMRGTFFEDAVFKRLKSAPPDGRGLIFRSRE